MLRWFVWLVLFWICSPVTLELFALVEKLIASFYHSACLTLLKIHETSCVRQCRPII